MVYNLDLSYYLIVMRHRHVSVSSICIRYLIFGQADVYTLRLGFTGNIECEIYCCGCTYALTF